MKTDSIALTRPRMASGVLTSTSTRRMTTLTMSDAPSRNSMASDSHRFRDSPNPTIDSPNTPTLLSRMTPARWVIGRRATMIAVRSAPTAGALRSRPSPAGPTKRMSRAYTGSSAVAPPNRTANRSNDTAPRTTG